MEWIISYLGIGSVISVAVIGAIRFRSLSREMKVLLFFFIIDASLTIFQLVLAILHTNNLWSEYIYILIEYGFFMWFFSQWIPSPPWKRAILISIPLFVMLLFVSLLTIEDLAGFSQFVQPLKSLLFIIVSISVISITMRDLSQPILVQPQFWISAGALIYNAGNITLSIFASRILGISKPVLIHMWMVHNVVAIGTYFLYAGGFLCQRR